MSTSCTRIFNINFQVYPSDDETLHLAQQQQPHTLRHDYDNMMKHHIRFPSFSLHSIIHGPHCCCSVSRHASFFVFFVCVVVVKL